MKPKAWTMKDIIFLQDNYEDMTNQELADKLDRSYKVISNKLYELGLRRTSEFILYEGDELKFTGTQQECADYWGVKINTINYYAAESYHKRIKDKPHMKMAVKL